MDATEKLSNAMSSMSLVKIIILSFFILLLISTSLYTFFNYKNSAKKVENASIKEMTGLVQTFSLIFSGDSIEADLLKKQKNLRYDEWNVICDSALKKNNLEYLYVMNIDYNDSIEVYISAIDPNFPSKDYFLSKENIADFPIEEIEKLKKGKESTVSFVSNTPDYGELISTYVPIKNSNGKIVAFAGADKKMDDMVVDIKEIAYNFIIAGVLFISTVFLMMMYVIKKMLFLPIKKIITAADSFNLLNVSFDKLNPIGIKEYDALIVSFVRMEEKINEAVKKSFTDYLTKLKNRYFFTIYMGNILQPMQNKKKIAFFIMDIDHFKQINDNYGHEKGDFVLKSMGSILSHLFGDLPSAAARLGGDEFVVCLDNISDIKIVEEKCEALKKQLFQLKYVEDKAGITVSTGVIIVEFDTQPPRYSEIFTAVDSNLYMVKASGRNGYKISWFKAS